jgi:hypothetical protein
MEQGKGIINPGKVIELQGDDTSVFPFNKFLAETR